MKVKDKFIGRKLRVITQKALESFDVTIKDEKTGLSATAIRNSAYDAELAALEILAEYLEL